MRSHFIMLAAMLFAAPAQANGTWVAGQAGSIEHAASLSAPQDSGTATLRVYCAANVAYIAISYPVSAPGPAEDQLRFTIDGRDHWLHSRYLDHLDAPAWSAVALPNFIEALKSGRRGTAELITEKQSAEFPLTGADPALSETLQGCGEGTGHNASWVTAFAPQGTSAVDPPQLDLQPVRPVLQPLPVPKPAAEPEPEQEQEPLSQVYVAEFARKTCGMRTAFYDGAISEADFDGDGKKDWVLNWAAVRCTDPDQGIDLRGAGFCSETLCGLDVFLSSVHDRGGPPQSFINDAEKQPQASLGTPATLQIHAPGAGCTAGQTCPATLEWNGSTLVRQP